MESARCSASAWDETSIAQASSPAASISANVACSAIASGVVRSVACSTPPTTCETVPSRPHRRPVASSSPRTRNAVVVLPLVPVMPTTGSRAVGSPWKRAAAGAIAARTESTTTSSTPQFRGRSTTSGPAPPAIAAGAGACPSRVKPGTQKNSVPGPTSRVSWAKDETSTSPPAPISSRSLIAARVVPVPASGLIDRAASPPSLPGRDLQIRQREGHDLAERRRRDLAAVDRALRLVDHDHAEQARVQRGGEPDEGGDVARARVLARGRVHLVRGAGLAGELVAGDRNLAR